MEEIKTNDNSKTTFYRGSDFPGLGKIAVVVIVAAIIIGGETATAICIWIYKSFIPVIIYASTILILFGLLTMYLAGEKALVPGMKTAKHEGEK